MSKNDFIQRMSGLFFKIYFHIILLQSISIPQMRFKKYLLTLTWFLDPLVIGKVQDGVGPWNISFVNFINLFMYTCDVL